MLAKLKIIYFLTVTVNLIDANILSTVTNVTNRIGLTNVDPEVFYTTPQSIESRGFKYEAHFVTTSDGYILQLFRIINPYNPKDQSIRPVLLGHGFESSSDIFNFNTKGLIYSNNSYIEKGPNDTLINDCNMTCTRTIPFTLSSCGFDVWYTNNRGNIYSKNHTNLSSLNPDFWRFTIDDLALKDLPAMIDYILKTTNRKTLAYVGYSLGTTVMFALQSIHPEFGEKIKPFIALAPVAFVANQKGDSLTQLSKLEIILRQFPGPKNLPQIVQQSQSIIICNNTVSMQYCIDYMSNTFGNDSQQLVPDRVPPFFAHFYEQTSTWVYAQLAQFLNTNKFCMFNFNNTLNRSSILDSNQKHYGQPDPPEYPLCNITSKDIILFRGLNDYLADDIDAKRLISELCVPFVDYVCPNEKWNHVDYVIARSANHLTVKPILQYLYKYNNEP